VHWVQNSQELKVFTKSVSQRKGNWKGKSNMGGVTSCVLYECEGGAYKGGGTCDEKGVQRSRLLVGGEAAGILGDGN